MKLSVSNKLISCKPINVMIAFIFFISIGGNIIAQSLTSADIRKRAVWDATSLDITVDLTKEQPTFKGTITLKTEDKAVNGPILILNNDVASMEMTNLKVENITKGSVKLSEQEYPNKSKERIIYVFDFKSSIIIPSEIKISFEYKFIKEQGQVINRKDLSYASWVTFWYPIPIDDTESLISVKNLNIPGSTSFNLPKDWHALSNGKLILDEQNKSMSKQTWEVGSNIARSYIAAPFNVSSVKQGDIDIKMYLLSKNETVAENKARQLAKIIDVLENAFGEYPYNTFSLAEIPDGTTDYFAASSEQGFIVAESQYFVGNDGLPTFAHEAGHSWWGNLFSCEGSGASLCTEALAQLGAILVIEALNGNEAKMNFLDVSPTTFSTYESARGYFAMVRSKVDEPLVNIENNSWKVHRLMDSKGTWFWQMLRHKLGDDLFFEILQKLTQQKKNMTIEDVQSFFCEESDVNLNPFFNQWLKRIGAPIITMEWETPNDLTTHEYLGDLEVEDILLGLPITEFKVNLRLTQEQIGLYNLKIPIEFQFYSGETEIKELDIKTLNQTYEFTFKSNIKNIILDPEHTILMWRPAYGPKPK